MDTHERTVDEMIPLEIRGLLKQFPSQPDLRRELVGQMTVQGDSQVGEAHRLFGGRQFNHRLTTLAFRKIQGGFEKLVPPAGFTGCGGTVVSAHEPQPERTAKEVGNQQTAKNLTIEGEKPTGSIMQNQFTTMGRAIDKGQPQGIDPVADRVRDSVH
ncbi:MAG: hypothetical protein K9N23_03730 [Akkermansiaceae bacterium]|nr:hypothetical protein [Akkermansiaceae bacterium]